MTSHSDLAGPFEAEAEASFVEGLATPLGEGHETGSRSRAGLRLLLWVMLLVLAVLVATIASPEGWHAFPWIACFGVLIFCLDRLFKTSRNPLRLDVLTDTRDILFATSVAAISTLSLRVLFTGDTTVASHAVGVWAVAIAILVPGRIVLSRMELRDRREGISAKPTLIVGAGTIGQLVAKRLLEHPELGLRPVGFLDKEPLPQNGSSNAVPVLGASWDFDEIAGRYGISHVVMAFSTAPHDVLLRTVRRCHELGIPVSFVPRLFERVTTKLRVEHVGGLPLVSICPADPKGWRFRLKYTLEPVVAGVVIVVILPLLSASALAVWISLGRPIFYRQRRMGLDGQEFDILKFRSMSSAPGEDQLTSLPADTAPGGVGAVDRRTRAGKFIRKTSIDELPQLINVLRGEMSLVGPRPERPEYAEIFNRDVHRYSERVRVKSGITGWAQVNGLRGRTSLTERVELDNYYIENWSFRLDLKILLLTVREMLRFEAD
jgi:exopolysaccharide biosynthesis polyprenyl glycosylphosphotransferase